MKGFKHSNIYELFPIKTILIKNKKGNEMEIKMTSFSENSNCKHVIINYNCLDPERFFPISFTAHNASVAPLRSVPKLPLISMGVGVIKHL